MSVLLPMLLTALKSQLVGGAFILAISGTAVAALHRIPGRIASWLNRQCVVSVELLDRDPPFQWVASWLHAHPSAKRLRSLTVASEHTGGEGSRTQFSPGRGTHLLWQGRRPIWVVRDRNATNAGVVETLTLRTLGRSQAPLRGLIEQAHAHAFTRNGRIRVSVSQRDYWQTLGDITPRPLSTVILPDGMVERIVQDLTTFRASEAWYREHGIPWRRGYLLEGPPGTGKSSLIAALAGEFNLPLYLLNLNSNGLSDEGLLAMLGNLPQGAALVLEDIDAVAAGRELAPRAGSDPSTVTFTGLLNALDGIAAKTGLVVFMTTNHVEHLDPALIRPGRIDERFTFYHATPTQIAALFAQIYGLPADHPDARAFAEALPWETPSVAELQQLLLRHRNDPAGALAAVRSA